MIMNSLFSQRNLSPVLSVCISHAVCEVLCLLLCRESKQQMICVRFVPFCFVNCF